MPRHVTLVFGAGPELATRTGELVESSPTALTVRLDEPVDDSANNGADAAAVPGGDSAIVAVVHAPGDGTGSAFLLTTRLANSAGGHGLVRVARATQTP